MKIAIPAPGQIPARRANTIQVMKMAQALVQCGHQILLMVPGSRPELAPSELRQELAHHYGLESDLLSSTEAWQIEWLPAASRWRRYDFALSAVRRSRRWGAALLYTRLPQAACLASWSGLPTILEVHDIPHSRSAAWLLRLFLAGRGSRRLVVITRQLLQDLSQHCRLPSRPGFVQIAPDGVDLQRYADLPEPAEARRRLGLPEERFTAGYTGHLYPGRGVELLLQIARFLPEVTFLIAGGEPSDVQRMRQQTAADSLQNVILTGFVPNAELPLYQAACEALLMPYQQRVAASSGGDIAPYLSPMKAFEYLACGRAILCSDLPVLREILHPDNAILLPKDEVAAWVAALQRLQTDVELRQRLGAQARREATRYSWEQRAANLLSGLW